MVAAETTLYSLFLKQTSHKDLSLEEVSNFEVEEEVYKQKLTPILSNLLSLLVLKNTDISKKTIVMKTSSFDAKVAPDISIQDYFERIVKYTPCSKECYLAAFIYIDRIIKINNFKITPYNVHRVLITSIMLASKLLDDHTFDNKYYSYVAGLTTKELNCLEINFLELLGYNLSVTEEVFRSYQFEVEKQWMIKVNEKIENVSEELSGHLSEDQGSTNSEDSLCSYHIKGRYIYTGSPHHQLADVEKKLRRSKSLSSENCFIRIHRRKRSNSFHIEVLPLA
jgi:hypothetical protein